MGGYRRNAWVAIAEIVSIAGRQSKLAILISPERRTLIEIIFSVQLNMIPIQWRDMLEKIVIQSICISFVFYCPRQVNRVPNHDNIQKDVETACSL